MEGSNCRNTFSEETPKPDRIERKKGEENKVRWSVSKFSTSTGSWEKSFHPHRLTRWGLMRHRPSQIPSFVFSDWGRSRGYYYDRRVVYDTIKEWRRRYLLRLNHQICCVCIIEHRDIQSSGHTQSDPILGVTVIRRNERPPTPLLRWRNE